MTPATINPATQIPYGSEFPLVTVEDMVDVQKRLIDLLGIARLRAVVGGSLGAHQALCWATRHPEYVQTAVVIAGSARITAQAIAFDAIGVLEHHLVIVGRSDSADDSFADDIVYCMFVG